MNTMSDDAHTRAIEEIKQLKARYFRCMDTKDWAGYLDVFTPDATVDSSEAYTPTDRNGDPILVDGVPPPAPDPAWRSNDIVRFVAELSGILNGVVTVHHGHMPEITLTSPTTATGIWSMEDMLRWPKGSPIREMHGYGHYRETYERLPAGWRIKTLKLTRLRVDTTP
jgi:hypothetical protein